MSGDTTIQSESIMELHFLPAVVVTDRQQDKAIGSHSCTSYLHDHLDLESPVDTTA